MGHLTLLPGSVSATDFFVQTEGSSFFWQSSFLYLRRIFAFQLNCCRCNFLLTSASASLGSCPQTPLLQRPPRTFPLALWWAGRPSVWLWAAHSKRVMDGVTVSFSQTIFKAPVPLYCPSVWPASLCPMGYPSWSPACMLDSLLLYLPPAPWNWWLATSSTQAGSEHGSRLSV